MTNEVETLDPNDIIKDNTVMRTEKKIALLMQKMKQKEKEIQRKIEKNQGHGGER